MVGRRDPSLTPLGASQAAAVAAGLSRSVSGAVVVLSSPLRRAFDTATPIAAEFGCAVDALDDLVELDYGDIEGRNFADLASDWPPEWVRDPDVPVPGGESYRALENRVVAAIDAIRAASADAGVKSIIVVTHLGPVKAYLKHVLAGGPMLYAELLVGHGSVSKVCFDDKGGRVVSVNVEPI